MGCHVQSLSHCPEGRPQCGRSIGLARPSRSGACWYVRHRLSRSICNNMVAFTELGSRRLAVASLQVDVLRLGRTLSRGLKNWCSLQICTANLLHCLQKKQESVHSSRSRSSRSFLKSTLHAHTAHTHSMRTQHNTHTHTAHTQSTRSTHTAHTQHTDTAHTAHTAHTKHSQHTQHTHNTHSTHSTHTAHTHTPYTQHAHSTHTAHTHSTHNTHTQHTHSTRESRHVGQPCLTRYRESSELSRHLVTVAAGNRRGKSLQMSLVSCAILVLLSVMERPLLTRLHDVIASCPPAQLAHQNATLTPSFMNHERSRLQGKAGKAIDVVTLSRFWKHASSSARETIQSVAGPSTGLLWSDCSRDERSGWLQDHHFQQAFLNRLSLPRVTPGSICALAPQSGARKGQLCGMPLALVDTLMALAGLQAHVHVFTTRSATVLPTSAEKRD